MFAIKVNSTGKFIDWCDNCWYLTLPFPKYKFTREECEEIYNLLDNHYVYTITLVDEDGNEEVLSRFESKVKPISSTPQKKPLFKLNSGVLKKGGLKFGHIK